MLIEHTCGHCSNPFQREKSKRAKFCSAVCHDASRRRPRPMCAHCGLNPIRRVEDTYCSRACAVEASKKTDYGPCERCGKTKTVRDRKFCSVECATLGRSRRKAATGTCQQCGGPTKQAHRQFCSIQCLGIASRTDYGTCICGKPKGRSQFCSRACAVDARRVARHPCAACGKPVKNNKNTYCSIACGHDAKRPDGARMCKVCGTQRARYRRLTCSDACNRIIVRQPRNPRYSPELIAKARELRADPSLSGSQIAEQLGISVGAYAGLTQRHGIRLGVKKPKPARPAPKPKAPQFRTVRPTPEPPIIETRRGIPLREVIRLAAKFGVARDIEAVSEAERKENPAHPGYRLINPVRSVWVQS